MRGWGTARGGLWRGDCWAGSRRTSRRPRGRGRRTERGASWSCRTYYQPSPWLQSFVSVFPLEMTDSATKGSSCLSGAIPGPGAPTPCRGCEALIKEAAEARDRAGQEAARPQRGAEAGGRGQEPAPPPAPGARPARLRRSPWGSTSATPLIHHVVSACTSQNEFLSFAQPASQRVAAGSL